jgi:hypothetical protein
MGFEHGAAPIRARSAVILQQADNGATGQAQPDGPQQIVVLPAGIAKAGCVDLRARVGKRSANSGTPSRRAS